jgi:hypothetical protein
MNLNYRLILRDLHDLVIIAKSKYEQSTTNVQKCCDILHANRLLQNLKKESFNHIDYYLPIILYIWKPIELGITYEVSYHIFFSSLIVVNNKLLNSFVFI